MADIAAGARRVSKRHVRRILILLGLVVASIIGLNNLTFSLIRAPENIGTAQMIYGWARIYKPMLYDYAEADSVSFGYSWVRDLYDPVKASALTGERFFNFGMSGATSFESRRLIENMLYIRPPKRVFLDVESFYDAPPASLVESQFDERLLYVNRDGSVNRRARLERFIKLNSSGAALGFNMAFLKTLYLQRQGVPVEDLLPSYERRDWRDWSDNIAQLKGWLEGTVEPPVQIGDADSPRQPDFEDLRVSMQKLCEANVEINLVESPYICGSGIITRRVRALAKEIGASCKAPISYNSFRYANAVTIEGIVGTPRLSTFYRPDGHPRPSLGQMMLTRIMGLEGKPGAPPLPKDWGGDLMAMSDAEAEAWIAAREGRCDGSLSPGALAAMIEEAEALTPEWRRRYGPAD